MGPDPDSCNTVEDTGRTVAQGFNELPNLNKLSNSADDITLRVWEKGDTNDVDHKQLTDNPDIQVTYIDTPNVPADLEAAASSAGSGGVACDTTNPGTNGSASGLPHIGKTDSTNGPFIVGTFTTDDTNSVAGSIKYWNNATPSTTTTIKTATGTGRLSAEIPATFTSGLANGTVIGYQAQASDSFGGTTYASAFSKPCYFAVDPTAPNPPTVTTSFDQSASQPVGTALTFTVTQAAGDTATKFVWDLDNQPPTTSPPADMTCTASSTTCPLANGGATITITVPSPGPRILWLYEMDTAGNESGWTSLGSPGSSATFTGAADPAVSYTAGASLAANFAAALGAGQPYDNTIISTQAGQSGTANGDGGQLVRRGPADQRGLGSGEGDHRGRGQLRAALLWDLRQRTGQPAGGQPDRRDRPRRRPGQCPTGPNNCPCLSTPPGPAPGPAPARQPASQPPFTARASDSCGIMCSHLVQELGLLDPVTTPVRTHRVRQVSTGITQSLGPDCNGLTFKYGACPSERGAAGTTPQQVKASAIGAAIILGGAILDPLLDAALGIGAAAEDAGTAAGKEITTYYPPDRGFFDEPTSQNLETGTRIDRYGREGGTFVSPEGTPEAMRALPPGATTRPYNIYEVVNPIEVRAGTVAPWFGQLGLGTQYELPDSVGNLIENGYLKLAEDGE